MGRRTGRPKAAPGISAEPEAAWRTPPQEKCSSRPRCKACSCAPLDLLRVAALASSPVAARAFQSLPRFEFPFDPPALFNPVLESADQLFDTEPECRKPEGAFGGSVTTRPPAIGNHYLIIRQI